MITDMNRPRPGIYKVFLIRGAGTRDIGYRWGSTISTLIGQIPAFNYDDAQRRAIETMVGERAFRVELIVD